MPLYKKFKQNYFEPMMQVRNSNLIFYAQATEHFTHKRALFTKPTYTGTTTTGSCKRIKKAVDILCQVSPPIRIFNPVTQATEMHTLSFITLTIPGKEKRLTAKEGYDLLLSKWLRKMRSSYGLKSYIWKAEFQKNGQLHYHITTNSWIHYKDIRNEWNTILQVGGMLSEWKKVKPDTMPNSTDVHKVYKVKNIQAYLAKYLAKDDPLHKTKGKIWDCSLNIKKAKFFAIQVPNDLENYLPKNKIEYFDRIGILKTVTPLDYIPPKNKEQYYEWRKGITEQQETDK